MIKHQLVERMRERERDPSKPDSAEKSKLTRLSVWLANQNGFTGVEWPTNNETLARACVEGRSIVDRLLPGLERQSAFVEGENKDRSNGRGIGSTFPVEFAPRILQFLFVKQRTEPSPFFLRFVEEYKINAVIERVSHDQSSSGAEIKIHFHLIRVELSWKKKCRV